MQKNKTALLVIDVQEKLLPVMHEAERTLERIVRLARAARLLEWEIHWLEQYPRGLGPTVGALREALDGLTPVAKRCFSAWDAPEIRSRLREPAATRALVCGIESHVCVWQTARDLRRAGYETAVATDATTSRDPRDREAALELLRAAGVTLTTSEIALFEDLGSAAHPRFREISALVR